MSALNLRPLEKALKQLEFGLQKMSTDPDNELGRDGVIQRFEYSMDLSWKLIQRYLKVIAQVDDAAIRTKDLFREAARLKLIADAEAWIGHLEARNETSHVYNAEVAQIVFERACKFLPDANSLLEALRNATSYVRPDHLTIVRDILKRFVPDHRVVAFGSRVAGKSEKTSDLDLCIMSDQPIPFETLGAIRDTFSDSNIPYKVDVLDWSSLAPDFRQIIAESCWDIQSQP